MAQSFYKGEEVKFAIDITAVGFSMDDDDFDVKVASPKDSVTASKNAPAQDNSLIIFKEGGDSSDSSSSSSGADEGTWYAIVDTSKLSTGELKVTVTAYVPDTKAIDAIRKQIDVKTLGTLKNA